MFGFGFHLGTQLLIIPLYNLQIYKSKSRSFFWPKLFFWTLPSIIWYESGIQMKKWNCTKVIGIAWHNQLIEPLWILPPTSGNGWWLCCTKNIFSKTHSAIFLCPLSKVQNEKFRFWQLTRFPRKVRKMWIGVWEDPYQKYRGSGCPEHNHGTHRMKHESNKTKTPSRKWRKIASLKKRQESEVWELE